MCLFFFSSSRSLCLLFLSCHVKWTSSSSSLIDSDAHLPSLSVSTLVLALSFAHTLCENADDFVLFFSLTTGGWIDVFFRLLFSLLSSTYIYFLLVAAFHYVTNREKALVNASRLSYRLITLLFKSFDTNRNSTKALPLSLLITIDEVNGLS